jgi:hypothetical protein
MPDEDPENAKHEFAFDNPAFKGNLQNFIHSSRSFRSVAKISIGDKKRFQ